MRSIKSEIFKILFVLSCPLLFVAYSTAPGEELQQQSRNDYEPVGIFLTWQQDPTSTMTIDWQTEPGDQAIPELRYKEKGTDTWQSVSASQHEFPYSDRVIHRVELTGLEAARYYRFQLGEFERMYKFRTMPERNYRPVRFAAGGDTRFGDRFKATNHVAMQYDPDFIAWGGDLAYADGLEERLYRWYEWFDRVRDDLITEQGRVVPIVLAIGNHDVIDHHYHGDEDPTDEMRKEKGPYFYSLFAFPGQPGYGVLDFGNYLSLISLDTAHSNPIGVGQTQWLEEILQEREGTPHIIPFYHKAAYPSHRVEVGGEPTQPFPLQIRKHWVPLFEKYGVRVALDNDDHTYKRTYPLRNDLVDPSGIVYIGDGAWGVQARDPKTPEEVWYLKRSARKNHAIIVTLHGAHQHFLMVNNKGEIIDEYPETP